MFDTEDYTETGDNTPSLADLRAAAPCLCLSCWGETDQVECVLGTEATARNRSVLEGSRS